jgi:thiamine-monophosphate kinase
VRPPIRLADGKTLALTAHALLDVSDGLVIDAGHIASRSGCRVVIELERVPLAEGAELNDLGFGEDYELLAAVATRVDYATIGHCEEGEGVAVTLDGRPYELGGWQHFR